MKLIIIRTKFVILWGLVLIFNGACTDTYIGRYMWWGSSDYNDHLRFPNKKIQKGQNIYHFQKKQDPFNAPTIELLSKDNKIIQIEDLNRTLKENETTSFIIIKNDKGRLT